MPLLRRTLPRAMLTGVTASFLAGSIFTACSGGESEPACVQTISTACTPQYEPTFEQIYTRTLRPSCGQAGGLCHAADGAKGGLVLDDLELAYQGLTGANGARARVLAGDPECSVLTQRLEAAEPSRVMPPGAPLRPEVRCAIYQWIEMGAPR